MTIELWFIQECLEKLNQRGKTSKLRKGEQSFLCWTRRPDLIHISIKLREDILICHWIMKCTRMFGKINQMGITWKIRKGEQSFLCMTHRCDLIHIPIKLHDDIPNSYWAYKNVWKIKRLNYNTPPFWQITLLKFDEIHPLKIPNQISKISMHIPSLVKIRWRLLNLSSGNEKRTDGLMDGRT